jgi:MoaA/NifB/PqqE/SkfB family radical SAM enzyme
LADSKQITIGGSSVKAVCKHPWLDAWVNARGFVTCCPQNRTVFGDVNEEDFDSIWNSPAAQKVRQQVAEEQYEEAGCEADCPFLRGSFVPPDEDPPKSEMINPDFIKVNDGKPYAENYKNAFDDYEAKNTVLKGYPLFVDIQPILRCNYDCIMCGQPHESPLVHSDEVTNKLEGLKPYANFFRWQGGEIFLKRGLFDYLVEFDKSCHPNLRRCIITNGSILDEKRLRALCEGDRPANFLVSIDGVSEETYNHIRKRGHYKKAMATLKILSDIQKERGVRDLVKWNYVVMRSNLGEMKDAIDMAEDLGVDINFAPIQGGDPEEDIYRCPEIRGEAQPAYFENLQAYAKTKIVSISGLIGMKIRLENGDKRVEERSKNLISISTSS